MVKSWALSTFITLATTFSTARSYFCDDINDYLDVPLPLEGDTTIELDVRRVNCPELDGDPALEEIIVRGGALTLSSASTVRFVNLRFTVEDGASLVFDMPKTQFGPSDGSIEGPGYYFMLDVKEGGSATFTGEFGGRKVDNVRSLFYNAGSMEFKGDALFQDTGNVFRSNSGTLKFRGDTIFKDNSYLPIENIESGYVRFSKTVVFDGNAYGFDGSYGGAIGNLNSEGTVIFRGDATFDNNSGDYGGAVYNRGKMRFYGKTRFNNNRSVSDGGAVDNYRGDIIFKAAAQFNDNTADSYGGGLNVEGGDVTFKKGVLFSGNQADDSGGAFSVRDASTSEFFGSLTFEKPSATNFRGNTLRVNNDNQVTPTCTLGYVEDGSTLVGFPDDDVCVD